MELILQDDCIVVSAPAKLNLFLEVTGCRDDGYHDLDTVMQAIDLRDTLTLQPGDRLELVSPQTPDVPQEQNLVMRAARGLQQAMGVNRGARIHLEKRIPSGAGLGGGSSDAASALVGLARLWSIDVPDEVMHRIAAGLGSDVPFFLHGGIARCKGRGEKIFPVSTPVRWYYLLVVPPTPNRTAEIYKALDGVGTYQPKTADDVCRALETGSFALLRNSLFNRLEDPGRACNKQVDHCLAVLADRVGCMTGSGSTCFVPCSSDSEAKNSLRRLRALLPDCTVLAVSDVP